MYITFQKLPSKSSAAEISYSAGAIESSFQAKNTVENCGALGAGLESYSRGQRTRQGRNLSHGQRSQGRVASSRPTSRKRSTTSNSRRIGKLHGWKGTPNGQGRVRGRRSIRSWQKPAVKMNVINGKRDIPKDIMEETLIFVREEINEGETEANVLNVSNSERSDYEGDRYGATEDVDMDDDVDDNIKDGQVDLIIGGDSNTGYIREDNEEKIEDPDGVGSTSLDYSD